MLQVGAFMGYIKNMAIPCQSCHESKDYCQYCKSITKAELADIVKGNVRVYLSERNRANQAKPISDYWIMQTREMSCRQAAKRLGVSAQTVSRARRAYKARHGAL